MSDVDYMNVRIDPKRFAHSEDGPLTLRPEPRSAGQP